ncbi:hypothetical protein [Streptomyces sp. NPDC059788]|uniref:hypothetical protein n=1 Tax=Streptomyces sp. NPDC059788 TaxID=3346948 RepID=UPI003650B2F5
MFVDANGDLLLLLMRKSCGSAPTGRGACVGGSPRRKGGKPASKGKQPEPIIPGQLLAAHTDKQIHPKAALAAGAGLAHIGLTLLDEATDSRLADTTDADEAVGKEIQPRHVDRSEHPARRTR